MLVGLSTVASAEKIIEQDDFTGTDGDAPDPTIWTEVGMDTGDFNRIESNTLRVKQATGWGGVEQKNNFTTNNFTVLVDWKPRSTSGRMFTLTVATKVGADMKLRIALDYDHFWGWHINYVRGGTQDTYVSSQNNARTDTWFTINITVWNDKANFTVKDRGTGAVKFSRTGWSFDGLNGENLLKWPINSDAYYDNYRLIDLSMPPNEPPEWGFIDELTAVEDIPVTYNFSANVSDPDHDILDLRIHTVSQYVVWTRGLEVRFLFPNGVTEPVVWLVLTDGWDEVVKGVVFNVTPVNDPPEQDIPEQMLAREDTPLFVDLAPNVWDVDDDLTDLYIVVDSPYVVAGRLNLTVTFPEGVLEYELAFNLTDGELSVPVTITFVVAAVDDPPVVTPLGEFEAIEDETSVFNISSHLSDVDTPIEDLSLLVRSSNCTVVGHELHLLYTLGGVTEEILVQVTDGTTMVDAYLTVTVSPRNDAPVAHTVSPKLAEEDEPKTVDVWPYVEDEDTPKDQLMISCDHPACMDVSGFNITLLYPTWMPEHQVNYTVSDGFLTAQGHFLVQVQEVNDAPVVVGIGDLHTPVKVMMDEGTELWFEVLVEDEDDTSFAYSAASEWNGVTLFANGSLRIIADLGDIGDFAATLTVDDGHGGKDTLDIAITVRNVNDPPHAPSILEPRNHTIVEEGTNLTFSVDLFDPDMELGQVLTVTWVSNVSGLLNTRTSEEELTFVTDALPVGEHRITVTVSDGEYEATAWSKVTITERYVPPPPPEPEPNLLTEPVGILSILIIVILVVIVVLWLVMRGRSRQQTAPPPQYMAPPPTTVEVEEEGPEEPSLESLAEELGRMTTDLERQRAIEKSRAPPPPVLETAAVPDLEMMGEVSENERADRLHATRVREVGKALTQLPRGLPTTLSSKDLSQLAREIVDGPKRTAPDGTPLVQVDGRWFSADHTNVGTFLQEHREDAGPGVAVSERAKRLEQLETRLLEGKISEETYERLRKKYEG